MVAELLYLRALDLGNSKGLYPAHWHGVGVPIPVLLQLPSDTIDSFNSVSRSGKLLGCSLETVFSTVL